MNATDQSKKMEKQDQAKAEFAKLMEKVNCQGFYGTASVTVNVQDGHIQYSRVLVDRIVR